MKAVLCPVCNGRGKVKPTTPYSTASTYIICHGCGGVGWVQVEDDTYVTRAETTPYLP